MAPEVVTEACEILGIRSKVRNSRIHLEAPRKTRRQSLAALMKAARGARAAIPPRPDP
jgi:hypothetical protein